jgi:hypothetical protein
MNDLKTLQAFETLGGFSKKEKAQLQLTSQLRFLLIYHKITAY